MKQMITQLDREMKVAILVAAIGLIGGGFFLETYVLPEESIEVNEELPQEPNKTSSNLTSPQDQDVKQETDQESEEATKILKSGSFEGKTGHKVQGDIKIVEVNGETYLRFESYSQTQGPDVFVYLTPSKDPTSSKEISEGRKIRIDGGPDGGEITKEGNFNQKIPDDTDVEKYQGVSIWCDAFSVPFGAATLN